MTGGSRGAAKKKIQKEAKRQVKKLLAASGAGKKIIQKAAKAKKLAIHAKEKRKKVKAAVKRKKAAGLKVKESEEAAAEDGENRQEGSFLAVLPVLRRCLFTFLHLQPRRFFPLNRRFYFFSFFFCMDGQLFRLRGFLDYLLSGSRGSKQLLHLSLSLLLDFLLRRTSAASGHLAGREVDDRTI